VKSNPDDASGLQLLSQALAGQQDYAAAAAHLELAAQLVPTSPLILNNLAWVRQELGRDGAVDLARRAHQLAPSSPEIADTLGWLLVQNGDLPSGVELLREAARLGPSLPDIRYHLAWALHASGDVAGAKNLLESILASEQPFSERAAAETLLARLQ
jgi:Flp pilus assembly protein TadD